MTYSSVCARKLFEFFDSLRLLSSGEDYMSILHKACRILLSIKVFELCVCLRTPYYLRIVATKEGEVLFKSVYDACYTKFFKENVSLLRIFLIVEYRANCKLYYKVYRVHEEAVVCRIINYAKHRGIVDDIIEIHLIFREYFCHTG